MNEKIFTLVKQYAESYAKWKNATLSEDAIKAFEERSKIANQLAMEMMKLITK
jgi:hypothetical protein